VTFAKGVLPDSVIRDPRAEGLLAFVTLDPGLTRDGVQAWLVQVEALIRRLIAPLGDEPVARVVVGFGRSFFLAAEQPRFGLDGRSPHGFTTLPSLPAEDQMPDADVMCYVMTTSEAIGVEFLDGLSQTRSSGLTRVIVDRGFQRADGRELFGFLDGLRNVPFRRRFATVFVDRDRFADEPDWAEDGTYLAYAKISQNLDVWRALPVDAQEQIMGRRKPDGSRLDLPADTNPRSEGEYVGDPPAAASHVRKAGPRGDHGDVQIFRRGIPYFSLNEDGTPDAGLHFVSFQASLDQFDVVFNGWMMNPDFPPGLGQMDSLFSHNPALVSIRRGGFFFVPPAPPIGRFIGAQMFEDAKPDSRARKEGRLFVRKKVVSPEGQAVKVDLRGIEFEVVRASDQSIVGERFATDSAGHALSPPLPVREPLILREVNTRPNIQPPDPLPFQLERRREAVTVTNFIRQPGPYG
jgi:Dyp-type peroxidase family